MGLYATVTADVPCPTCGTVSAADWQFHLGAVGDLPYYQVGDAIRWEGSNRRQTYGSPDMDPVIAVGYLATEPWCPRCKHMHALADVHIHQGRIERVTFRSFEPWIAETLFVGPDKVPH